MSFLKLTEKMDKILNSFKPDNLKIIDIYQN